MTTKRGHNGALKIAAAAFYITTVGVVPALPQAALLPNAKQTFFDQNGNPLSSGKVYFYVPNTTQKKTTWSDAAETTANTNPVTLDAAGRAVIYGQGTYQQKVLNANGDQMWNAQTTAWNSSVPSGANGTDTAPVGTIVPWAGFSIPTNWALTNGDAVSRLTYSDLLTAITISHTSVSCTSGSATLGGWPDTSQIRVGAPVEATCLPTSTTVTAVTSSSTITVSQNATATATVTATVFPWGDGDGTLTFNLPDLRGRVLAGSDTMGSTAAGILSQATTISTTSGSALATTNSATGVYAGMTVVSANVPVGTTVSTTAGTTAASTTITTSTGAATAVVASTTNIVPGMLITSTNVPAGTTVSSIRNDVITMSANATATASGTAATFGITVSLSANATATASGTAATFYAFEGADASGASGGSSRHRTTTYELPNFSLSLSPTTFTYSLTSPQSGSGASAVNNIATSGLAQSVTASASTVTSQVGSNAAFPVIQPTLTSSFIIKIKANTTGAGGVVSWGGLFGDIATDDTLRAYTSGSVNYAGLATQDDKTLLANVSGVTAAPVPLTITSWFDATLGSARGDLVQRGPLTWTSLPIGSADTWLNSDGVNPSWQSLPVATSLTPGVIQGDGDTITIAGGVMSCTTATSSQTGCSKPDGTTIVAVGGIYTAVGAATTSVGVGTTTVAAGTDTYLLYNNAGVLGNQSFSGLLDSSVGSTPNQFAFRNGSNWTQATALTGVTAGTGLTGGSITSSGTIAADLATTSEALTATTNKLLDAATVFNGVGAPVPATATTTVTLDFSTGFNFDLATTAGDDFTLENPTNVKLGQQGCIYVTQPPSGLTVTISYGTSWQTAGGVSGKSLSTTNSVVDRICYLARGLTAIDFSLANGIAH
jgi:hypothetical protein